MSVRRVRCAFPRSNSVICAIDCVQFDIGRLGFFLVARFTARFVTLSTFELLFRAFTGFIPTGFVARLIPRLVHSLNTLVINQAVINVQIGP